MDQLYSVNISNNINLRQFKSKISGLNLIGETSVELFYKKDDKYLAIYAYGTIAFINYDNSDRNTIINLVDDKITQPASESTQIEFIELEAPKHSGNILNIPISLKNDSTYRIIMFDASQSVALDHYSKLGDTLLEQINKFSKELEETGDLDMSKKEIMKFIGKSLVTKNSIVDTLYIFDSPDLAWEDENVDKLHKFLAGVFDLKSRYDEIENMFKVVDDNLDVFRDLYQHKSTTQTEWIVIILIAIEILKSFSTEIGQLFK